MSGICAGTGFSTDMVVLVTGGALMSIFITALGYMVGNFLGNARIITWSKSELYQVVMAMVIAVAIIWLVDFSCSLDVSMLYEAGGTGSQLIQSTCTITGTTLLEAARDSSMCMAKLASDQLNPGVANSLAQQLGEMEISASQSEWNCELFCILSTLGYSESPNVGEYSIISVVTMALSILSTAAITSTTQYYILGYIATGMPLYFIPMAIALRSVPYFRDVGGILLALAFSLMVFYPAMVALFSLAFFSVGYAQGTDIYSLSLLYIGGIFLQILAMVATAVFGREVAALFGQEIDMGRLAHLV
ncbi:hypothetical protein COX84_05765 [Candidatus Micrarchaeota archaeon CG_4_10_14_0_2_um_filter_49_7]|nr:MAG: hypothetical protein AUJ13_05400 [Candidatus Micrarchaeota archaeon CG1_02_49_24]PIZ93684.1 MAG: hypothetical protein COX84_05765 [Candidatus Micrarchaeota archaeon CG_4_10_14_0_2_um_filter_49_7]